MFSCGRRKGPFYSICHSYSFVTNCNFFFIHWDWRNEVFQMMSMQCSKKWIIFINFSFKLQTTCSVLLNEGLLFDFLLLVAKIISQAIDKVGIKIDIWHFQCQKNLQIKAWVIQSIFNTDQFINFSLPLSINKESMKPRMSKPICLSYFLLVPFRQPLT